MRVILDIICTLCGETNKLQLKTVMRVLLRFVLCCVVRDALCRVCVVLYFAVLSYACYVMLCYVVFSLAMLFCFSW